MRLVFFQPDIPQNVGAAIRLAACFEAGFDLVEPCGFALTDKAVRRAAMDYGGADAVIRHAGWDAYVASPQAGAGRLLVFSTSGATNLPDLRFQAGDRLLFGRESAGVPEAVLTAADQVVRIPISPSARSLNVVVAAGIAVAQARNQLGWPAGME